MKIEKINDNQIRCTLNKQDLASRQIKLSELAYGTEKARDLFREMMKQASYEYGFEVDDQPLMIEAIPLSPDSIVLNISKVANPDELDTRFSKFAPMFGDFEESDEGEDAYEDLADSLHEALDFLTPPDERDEAGEGFMTLGELISNKMAQAKKQRARKPEEQERALVVRFNELSYIEKAAKLLAADYNGVNTLYKDAKNKLYYLVVYRGKEQEVFNKVTNVLTEYGVKEVGLSSREAFFKEHYTLMIKDNALQMLSKI